MPRLLVNQIAHLFRALRRLAFLRVTHAVSRGTTEQSATKARSGPCRALLLYLTPRCRCSSCLRNLYHQLQKCRSRHVSFQRLALRRRSIVNPRALGSRTSVDHAELSMRSRQTTSERSVHNAYGRISISRAAFVAVVLALSNNFAPVAGWQGGSVRDDVTQSLGDVTLGGATTTTSRSRGDACRYAPEPRFHPPGCLY